MAIDFIRKSINGCFFNYYENQGIVFGFTEKGFRLKDLSTYFHVQRLKELKQVHSDILCFSSEISEISEGMEGMEGDGIILDEPGTMAVIKTADCTPLFFWEKNYAGAGVIHIGWQGLLKGIEKKLMTLLEERHLALNNLFFYMGPAIEWKCYQVGSDLYEKFAGKWYREKIFYQDRMDIKKGIFLSLQESGVPAERIMDGGICTFCEAKRFPSYRREKRNGDTGGRIYNFLLLKAIPPQTF
jgi:YfiH family protein